MESADDFNELGGDQSQHEHAQKPRDHTRAHRQPDSDQGKTKRLARRHRNVAGTDAGQQRETGDPTDECHQTKRNDEISADPHDQLSL